MLLLFYDFRDLILVPLRFAVRVLTNHQDHGIVRLDEGQGDASGQAIATAQTCDRPKTEPYLMTSPWESDIPFGQQA